MLGGEFEAEDLRRRDVAQCLDRTLRVPHEADRSDHSELRWRTLLQLLWSSAFCKARYLRLARWIFLQGVDPLWIASNSNCAQPSNHCASYMKPLFSTCYLPISTHDYHGIHCHKNLKSKSFFVVPLCQHHQLRRRNRDTFKDKKSVGSM